MKAIHVLLRYQKKKQKKKTIKLRRCICMPNFIICFIGHFLSKHHLAKINLNVILYPPEALLFTLYVSLTHEFGRTETILL